MDAISHLTKSDCASFLEVALELYVVYTLGVNIKILNEQNHLFPVQSFSGSYFLLILLVLILCGLSPSGFSEHFSLKGDLVHGSHTSFFQNALLASSFFAVGISQNFLKKKEHITL
jgi:hypothetical protein